MKEKDEPNLVHLETKRQERIDEKYKTSPGIFQNWHVVSVKKEEKKEGASSKPVIYAKRPNQLIEELKYRLPNFINVNGDLTELRDNPKTGLFLPRPRRRSNEVLASLYATNTALDFKATLEGAVQWEPLVIYFADCVNYVTRVTKYPTWPVKPDHLVLYPGIEPEYNGSLDRLVDFFCPETDTDRKLIKALFCTPAWSEGQGKRPLFLIMGPQDADSNVSIGKSKLVEKLQKLYQAGADLPPELKPKDWLTTIMEMQTAQVVRFDNVRVKEWSSTVLERIVTSEMIAGHKLYAGHREYPNHITFVATINDPQLNADLASRSLVIRVRKPDTYGQWERNIDTWIEANRIDVLKDIGWLIMSQNIPDTDMNTQFRFPAWKETILNKIDTNMGDHIQKQSETLKASSSHEEWVSVVHDKVNRYNFVTGASAYTINTDQYRIFVASPIILEWYRTWLGYKVDGSGQGSEGKKLKKLCEQAGFKHSPQVKINTQPRAGYWINPETLSGPKVGIITQIRESPNAWLINSP